MLRRLLDLNSSIQQLVDEGYSVATAGGYLIVHDVPYVNSQGVVERATLADGITADQNSVPKDHTIWFTGSTPHDSQRQLIPHLNRPSRKDLGDGLVTQHQFSAKPSVGPSNYGDHFTKIVSYVAMLEGPAAAIEPGVTARLHKPIRDDDESSPFEYLDTASTRAGITQATAKLKLDRVAIVGLGGTGSYILDQLAKLPILEIHLWDPDTFDQHNAFRAPGAASFDDLDAKPAKVDYFKSRYAPMHKGIHAHAEAVTADNVDELASMQYVFMAFDGGPDKQALIESLITGDTPFIDVGMGLIEKEGTLSGQLRVSAITSSNSEMASDASFLPNAPPDDNDYDFNVQVADMNALNALLAVIRFKKHLGFYASSEDSHYYNYSIFPNTIINEHAP